MRYAFPIPATWHVDTNQLKRNFWSAPNCGLVVGIDYYWISAAKDFILFPESTTAYTASLKFSLARETASS